MQAGDKEGVGRAAVAVVIIHVSAVQCLVLCRLYIVVRAVVAVIIHVSPRSLILPVHCLVHGADEQCDITEVLIQHVLHHGLHVHCTTLHCSS